MQLLSASTLAFAAQAVITGAVVSTTLKVFEQLVELPAASVTVIVTVLAPRGALVPATGDCVIVRLPEQLSTATTAAVKSGTLAAQPEPASADWVGPHDVIDGAVVSFTVRVAVHVAVLPAASATVRVIVVLPRTAVAPTAGDCVTKVTAQLSADTTLLVKSGTSAVQFAPAETVWSAAQVVTVGFVVSRTVKVVVQVVMLPAASVTVSVIVLAPRTPAEPAAGDCVTEAMPQLSLATTPAVKFGTAAEQLLSALALWAAGHEVMTGAVVSWTVIVTVQVEELPAASVAVRVTGKLPTVTGVPAGND